MHTITYQVFAAGLHLKVHSRNQGKDTIRDLLERNETQDTTAHELPDESFEKQEDQEEPQPEVPADEEKDDATEDPQSERSKKGKQKEFRTTDIGSEPRPFDWTRFDVQLSLNKLRSINPTVVKTELRKLHLRWWHASEPKMTAVLRAVGVSTEVTTPIKPIVDSCRECRAWQRPADKLLPSFTMATKFNEIGECDIFFYHGQFSEYKVFHMIDRATRYADLCCIPNKERDTLVQAYKTTWVQLWKL